MKIDTNIKKVDPVYKDGVLLAVVRPTDAKKALEAAKAMTADELANAMNLLKLQEYRYMGVLGPDQEILVPIDGGDGWRRAGHKVQPGDSFVNEADLKRLLFFSETSS